MGNEYGISTGQILQMFGPTLLVGPFLVWVLVIGPLAIYPLARWKQNREQFADPQLGIKVALHYFAFVAFHIALFAGMFILFTVISKQDAKGDMFRMGFALLIPAGIVLAAHFVLLRRTNQDVFPIVRRLFLGYSLIITGLLGFIALLFAFYFLFRKGSAGDDGRLAIAATLVYVGAWAACGLQLARLVFDDHSASAPQHIVPPSPSAATQQSGPTLPSLSTGSFPPLDNK